MNVHVSLVMHPNATGEPKTKPMQNSVCLQLIFIFSFLVKLCSGPSSSCSWACSWSFDLPLVWSAPRSSSRENSGFWSCWFRTGRLCHVVHCILGVDAYFGFILGHWGTWRVEHIQGPTIASRTTCTRRNHTTVTPEANRWSGTPESQV